MGYRGAHQRRRPRPGGRADLTAADILLSFVAEALWLLFLLAAVFSGR